MTTSLLVFVAVFVAIPLPLFCWIVHRVLKARKARYLHHDLVCELAIKRAEATSAVIAKQLDSHA